MLARRPSILVMPLLAAVLEVVVATLAQYATDPLGGIGQGLIGILIQLIYGFAFGVAIIQANDAWRGHRASFDDAWEEGRRKAAGIMLAAIGFSLTIYVAGLVGSLLGGGGIGSLVLSAFAWCFLIYTIPAAAIGGLPGSLALSGSIRAARANVPAALVLAFLAFVLWKLLPSYVLLYATPLGPTGALLAFAGFRALVIAYLAFPFAKAYDDLAFRGLW